MPNFSKSSSDNPVKDCTNLLQEFLKNQLEINKGFDERLNTLESDMIALATSMKDFAESSASAFEAISKALIK